MSASLFALLESLVHRGHDTAVRARDTRDEKVTRSQGRGDDMNDPAENAESPPATDPEVLHLLEWSDSDSADDLVERANDLKRHAAAQG